MHPGDRFLIATIVALVLTGWTEVGSARTQDVDPTQSSFDSVLVVSNDGTCSFSVIVRSPAGTPIPYPDLVLGFSNCPLNWAATQDAGVTRIGNDLYATGSVVGAFTFHPRATGACSGYLRRFVSGNCNGPCPPAAYANGVQLKWFPQIIYCSGTVGIKSITWGRVRSLYR